MKTFRKLISLFLLLFLFVGFAVPTLAAESNKKADISFQFLPGDKAAAKAFFQIFRVGTWDNNDLCLDPSYQAYQVDVDLSDIDSLPSSAETLALYLRRDGVPPTQKTSTDAEGTGRFEDLEPGLYLLTGDKFTRGRTQYTPNSLLIALPYTTDMGKLSYSANLASIKYESHTRPAPHPGHSSGGGGHTDHNPPEEQEDLETVSIHVVKAWHDNGYVERPKSVTVQLLNCDGQIYDEIDLLESNSWRHTWENLEDGTYYVVEKNVSDGYIESVKRDGNQFVITNIKEPIIPEETKIPEEPQTPEDTKEPIEPKEELIPQTGQDATLILILAPVSIVFLFLTLWLISCNKSRPILIGICLMLTMGSISTATFMYTSNREKAKKAKKNIELVLPIVQSEQKRNQKLMNAFAPDFVLDSLVSMPKMQIDTHDYIGTIEIPSLNVWLPVIASWNKDNLSLAPCLYSGTIYDDNMIIGGHNYEGLFKNLRFAQINDIVKFTDMDGNEFVYEVYRIDTLNPDEKDRLIDENPELTLFTCTIGGRQRLAVRCVRPENRVISP